MNSVRIEILHVPYDGDVNDEKLVRLSINKEAHKLVRVCDVSGIISPIIADFLWDVDQCEE